ncbi:hypothetical protein HPB52_023256 [Rhipicephalus sanguineus]|uniref:Uncharacterized protein n=1 Tax=Rhipicephalus sanguineus TaxID=34632 RepID=A0A9D4PY80_RHISA|nr:hypothetical protein HPB52_023256 [Rhipicephalus sanguineus]
MEEFGVSHESASWPMTLCVIMSAAGERRRGVRPLTSTRPTLLSTRVSVYRTSNGVGVCSAAGERRRGVRPLTSTRPTLLSTRVSVYRTSSRRRLRFLVSLLEKKLSIYHISIGGSLLNFVALIAAFFAPNMTWMDITVGILSG